MTNQNTFTAKRTLIALSLAGLLTACGDNDNDFSNIEQPAPPTPTTPEPEPAPTPITAFAPDGTLSADVTWTTYGVPNVKADN
jgi:acyl-homoserine-lactone acylase